MNRYRLFFLAIFIVISGILIMIVRHASRSLPDFGINDPASVNRISLHSKGGAIELHRQDDSWLLNDSLQASPDMVRSFLNLMKDLEIKSPMSEEAFQSFLQDQDYQEIEVNISRKGFGSNHFLLYHTAANDYGNIVLKKNKNTPYILHLPGYPGDIGVYFNTHENDWKPNVLFSFGPGEISRISLSDHRHPERSFALLQDQNGSYHVFHTSDNEVLSEFIEEKVIRYISYFFNIRFEEYTSAESLLERGFKAGQMPIYTIDVEDHKGAHKRVHVYQLHKNSNKGNGMLWDPDLALASINEESAPVIIKYFHLDPILKDVDYFRK